jgi:hypothetical protein
MVSSCNVSYSPPTAFCYCLGHHLTLLLVVSGTILPNISSSSNIAMQHRKVQQRCCPDLSCPGCDTVYSMYERKRSTCDRSWSTNSVRYARWLDSYGVCRMVKVLRRELRINMAMIGARRARDLDSSMLNTRRLKHLLARSSCKLQPHTEQHQSPDYQRCFCTSSCPPVFVSAYRLSPGPSTSSHASLAGVWGPVIAQSSCSR